MKKIILLAPLLAFSSPLSFADSDFYLGAGIGNTWYNSGYTRIFPSLLFGKNLSEQWSLDGTLSLIGSTSTVTTLRLGYHIPGLEALSIGPKLGIGLNDPYFVYGASLAYDFKLSTSNSLGLEATDLQTIPSSNSISLQLTWKHFFH